MAKKKKITEIHGKVDEQTTKPTMLEQVWGYNELSKFGTTNKQEFEAKINDMNRTDLEVFARSKGVMIVEDTVRLRNLILKEFDIFIASLRKPVNLNKPQLNVSDAAKKILAEGR